MPSLGTLSVFAISGNSFCPFFPLYLRPAALTTLFAPLAWTSATAACRQARRTNERTKEEEGGEPSRPEEGEKRRGQAKRGRHSGGEPDIVGDAIGLYDCVEWSSRFRSMLNKVRIAHRPLIVRSTAHTSEEPGGRLPRRKTRSFCSLPRRRWS